MKTSTKVLIGCGSALGIVLLIAIISVSLIWSHRNEAVRIEERVSAQYVANQSNYDNMWKKFKEMTQVTELQAEQMKSIYKDVIEGRYKDNNLLFKFVQEQNPQLSPEVYTQLQREISAGRNTFDNNQKKITDIVREYNTYVKVHFIMAALTSREPMDTNKFIITSTETQKAFDTKKDDVIKLK